MEQRDFLDDVTALSAKLNAVTRGHNALLVVAALALELSAGLEIQATRYPEDEGTRRLRGALTALLVQATVAAKHLEPHSTVQ